MRYSFLAWLVVTEYLTADAYPDLGLKTGKWDSINYKKLKNNFTYETQQLNGIGKIMNMTMKEYLKSVQTPRSFLNRLTPNDPYMGRNAPLTSKRCILYIYSTNIGIEYFKHALHSPFFSLQSAVCFIMLTCLVPVLFTFYIQGVLILKKIIPAPKG
jgi:hypothetical protein